ncbi:MAG: PQQ-binding-like beta-propeller repeat protein [Bryobacteraceae bacterium]
MVFVAAVTYAAAADWLSFRGDPRQTGWQKSERILNTGNVKDLKLLWKLRLDNQSKGLNSLTAPTLLGPIITHRGIKELVFIAGASDTVYAVDADLGRLFWKRHFDRAAERQTKSPCGEGLTATPVIAPPAVPIQDADEGSTPLRPIYVLASDGRVHALFPSDGKDMASPMQFVPPDANASSLNFGGNVLSTTTPGGCGGAPNGAWALDLHRAGAKAVFSSGEHSKSNSATWHDAGGAPWTYVPGVKGITAFNAAGAPVWSSPDLPGARPPIIANGILFVLAGGGKSTPATLHALDALTGKQLYSSGGNITSFVDSSGLGLANGHVCFGTSDNTLYCFGIPLEI